MKFNATISADSAENLQVMAYRVANVIKQNEMVAAADSLAFTQSTEQGSLVIGVGGGLPAIPPKLTAQVDKSVPPARASDEELHEFAGVLWRKTDRDIAQGDVIIVVIDEDDEDAEEYFPQGYITAAGKVDTDDTVKVLGTDGYDGWVTVSAFKVLEPVRIK